MGSDRGHPPAPDPGADPGWDPGADPGGDPGADPGGDPGADPGGDPGADAGADPAARFEAAADLVVEGNTTALAELLESDVGLATRRSPRPHGATLLHYVAANGVEDERQRVPANAVEIAALLIDHGARIDATAEFYGGGPGSTPLVALVTSGHPQQAGLMEDLVHGFAKGRGSLDGLDEDGLPITMALRFRHPNAAHALAAAGAKVDNVAVAAGLGRLDAVRAGVVPGDPPTADPAGLHSFFGRPLTPRETVHQALYFAAVAGESDVIRFLIETGVDVNATREHGMTALHEAAWGGHREVVALLLAAGARADLRDRQFDATAIGWAAHAGHTDLVQILEGSQA